MKGNTIIKTIEGVVEGHDTTQIEYSSATFNPFSPINRKAQEAKKPKIIIENDAVTESTKGGGRASYLQTRLTAA